MRTAYALGAPLVLGVVFACASESAGPSRVSISPAIVVPRGLLDKVVRLTVSVYDQANGVDCDAQSHKVTGTTSSTPAPTQIDLKNAGCAPPARFCGDLALSSSSAPRVFAAVALGANGAELADGCAVQVANQDHVALTIPMVRNIPPSVCGDNQIGATEQCEPPGSEADQVCDANCQTKEEWLSHGSGTDPLNGTVDGASGEKVDPVFVWPSQSGATGRFLAAWGDKSPKSKTQVAMRVLGDALANDASLGPGPSSVSYYFPGSTSPFPPQSEMSDQFSPGVTIAAGKFFVVFQDLSSVTLDIHLRTMDITSPATGDQPSDQPIGINGTNGAGETGVQMAPAIAGGPNGFVFVAWQDAPVIGPGQIFGRAFNLATSTLTTQAQISMGTNNQRVQLAGVADGWIAVWNDGSDVKMRKIAADGSLTATEITVNDGTHHGLQDHPSVAALADGRFAVVWADHGAAGGTDIFVQRYAADGTPVAQDQAAPINNIVSAGEQVLPVIAGGSAAGGFFAVAWLDPSSNHVRARLLGGTSGFSFNNVDGQTDEFQASLVDGHARANPAIAIGGSGPSIAIGWEDLDASKPGIYARRFPVPSE